MPTRKPATKKTRAKSTRRTGNGQSAKMTSFEELFRHELADMFSAEHQLADALEELETESTNPELAKAFGDHRQQTLGHITRLEEVAESLEEELEEAECEGVKGLIEEKKSFAEEHPSPQILDVFNASAGQKSERYEITSYEGLIELAQRSGHREAVPLLQANMAEEEAALKKLKSLGARLEAPATSEMNGDEE